MSRNAQPNARRWKFLREAAREQNASIATGTHYLNDARRIFILRRAAEDDFIFDADDVIAEISSPSTAAALMMTKRTRVSAFPHARARDHQRVPPPRPIPRHPCHHDYRRPMRHIATTGQRLQPAREVIASPGDFIFSVKKASSPH